MRQPGRLRVSWENPSTMKLEFDAGTQTRLLHFDAAPAPAERSWQGYSAAVWEGPGVGRGGEIAPGNVNAVARGGQVVVPGGGGQGLRGGPAATRAGVDSAGRLVEGRHHAVSRGLPAQERRALQRAGHHHANTSTGCRRIPTATSGCT